MRPVKMFVLATLVGAVAVIGCSEDGGTGGSEGTAGTGGTAGAGGDGGMGGDGGGGGNPGGCEWTAEQVCMVCDLESQIPECERVFSECLIEEEGGNPCEWCAGWGLYQCIEFDPPSVSVFVTELLYDGDLGGLTGADEICKQEAADVPGVAPNWKAFLSGVAVDAKDRIPNGEYHLLDAERSLVARRKADLIGDELINPINKTASGAGIPGVPSAWTGTNRFGTTRGDVCADAEDNAWATNEQQAIGALGFPDETDETWMDAGSAAAESCSEELRLYCFEDIE